MLTEDEIVYLLNVLKWEGVAEFENGRYAVVKRRGPGYSDKLTVARIEGKLSIMLEVAHRRTAKS